MVSTAFTRLLKPLLLPLASGDHYIDPPVVLAPMAGITNAPFRMLCREQGAGLFVSEMITARALIERRPDTLRMIAPGAGEWPRSVQLYSVDPTTMRAAVTMIGKENLADHIDMNFGCPVPKVTRKGGGAALPFKRKLFSNIVGAAVEAAKPFGIPVTVKMRIGIDSDHETYLEAAKSAADLGVAWVALHARTAAQMYEGKADWSAIARLVEHLKPGMTVLVRTRDDADLEKLQSAGATEVIPELIEGSLMLASHVLLIMGVSMRKVVRRVTDAREQRYGLLRGYFRGAEDDEVSANQSWHLHSIPVQEGAKAIGMTLSELALEEDGVHIQAVRRKSTNAEYIKLELDQNLVLQQGDIVVLSGSPESIDLAEARLL